VPSSTALASSQPIKIAILHDLSGTVAELEAPLKDVALMTIEELNAKGGLLGRKLVPVVVDPRSNWMLFAAKAKELMTTPDIAVVFGCWTTVSRKAVLPALEQYDGLLFYPAPYEGAESSPYVYYTGSDPISACCPRWRT
jgi:urea transport system substrate-binding protein